MHVRYQGASHEVEAQLAQRWLVEAGSGVSRRNDHNFPKKHKDHINRSADERRLGKLSKECRQAICTYFHHKYVYDIYRLKSDLSERTV